MLTFLYLAAQRGFVVDSYVDHAVGHMGPNAAGRDAVARVVLRPAIRFSGARRPGASEVTALHHAAHEQCFIANSVTTQITIESPPGA